MSPSFLPGCEPLAVTGGADGVLVLHGYSGLPTTMRPLADAIANAGYTVSMPVLPGHGTSADDLTQYRWDDFRSAAEAAYDELAARCARTAIVGLSMGGGVAAHLAARAGEELAGVVAVNPWLLGLPEDVLALIEEAVAGGVTLFGEPDTDSDVKRDGDKMYSYGYSVLSPLPSVHQGLVAVREQLPAVTASLLLFTSREDHTISNESSTYLASRVSGSVTHVWLEDSWHVATVDADAPRIEADTLRFLQEVFS